MDQKTPLQIYNQKLKIGELKPDPAQEIIVQALDDLFLEVMTLHGNKTKKSWLKNLLKRSGTGIKGLYIYGGVGRGKSMLMDLFFEALPIEQKRRVHFHEFMIEVHDYINNRADTKNTLLNFARQSALKTQILCFDEFHVTNIADAMILGRLFTALFESSVTVVATSNWAPDDLYKDGLQRDRFLPFIDILKNHAHVHPLESPNDYRTQKLMDAQTYFYPLNATTAQKFETLYEELTDHGTPHIEILDVKGREISVDACGSVAKFSFAKLCESPLGAEDYLKIAQKYNTVFISGTPKLTYDRRNEAKRFILLIDALYEAGTHVIITAQTPPHDLYVGDDHAFEFERTVSRLMEMQSKEYLNKS